MKGTWILAGLVLAGAVGALAAEIFRPEPEARLAGPMDTSRLEARLAEVEDDLANVRAELADLENTPPPAPTPVAVDPAAVEGNAGTGDAAASAAAGEIPESELRETVEAVIEEKEREAREERARRGAEMAARRDAAMLDRLVEQLGLTPYQREEMEKLLAERRKLFDSFRDRFRGDGGPTTAEEREAAREEIRKAREELAQKFQQVLSPAQYEQFQQQESRGRGGPGGPGGGNRSGGRGGRGNR